MDHERQIRQLADDYKGALVADKAKEWFLQVARDFAASQERYNLESEFRKTRASRNYLVVLTILGSVLLVGGLAFWFTQAYAQENSRVEVSSSEFESVDLRDILENYRKLGAELAYRQAELARLRDLEQEQRAAALSRHNDQLALERGKNLSPEDLATRTRRLDAVLATELKAITERNRETISAGQAEVDQLEASIGAIDQEKLERALSLETVLGAERKLFDQETERTRSLYETRIKEVQDARAADLAQKEILVQRLERQAKELLEAERARLVALYNPRFESPEQRALLERPTDPARLSPYNARIPDEILADGMLDPRDAAKVNQELGAIQSLYRMSLSTPFQNDMPPLLAQLYARALSAVDEAMVPYLGFRRTILAKDREIAAKVQEITSLESRVAELEAQKTELQAQLKDQDSQLQAEKDFTRSVASALTRTTPPAPVPAMVIWLQGTDDLVAWVGAEGALSPGERVYATRKDTVPLGEFEVLSVNRWLALLRKVELSKDLAARLGRLDQRLRIIQQGDWIVEKESYILPGSK